MMQPSPDFIDTERQNYANDHHNDHHTYHCNKERHRQTYKHCCCPNFHRHQRPSNFFINWRSGGRVLGEGASTTSQSVFSVIYNSWRKNGFIKNRIVKKSVFRKKQTKQDNSGGKTEN